jgi:hypothetical protein
MGSTGTSKRDGQVSYLEATAMFATPRQCRADVALGQSGQHFDVRRKHIRVHQGATSRSSVNQLGSGKQAAPKQELYTHPLNFCHLSRYNINVRPEATTVRAVNVRRTFRRCIAPTHTSHNCWVMGGRQESHLGCGRKPVNVGHTTRQSGDGTVEERRNHFFQLHMQRRQHCWYHGCVA